METQPELLVKIGSRDDGFVSDRNILTDDDQMRLIHMRDAHRVDYFEIGNMANRYIRESAVRGLPITATRIYEAIARFCGKRPRTIRYYAEIEAFYADKDISEFDMLPFSFFSLARHSGEVAWREVLEYAALNPYIGLEELERASSGGLFKNFNETENLGVGAENRGGYEVATQDREDLAYKPRVLSKFAAGVLITALSDMVEQSLRVIRMVELPDELRMRLEVDVQDIKQAIPDVARYAKQKEPA